MHVDVFERPGDLVRLRENWERLYAADPEAHYFLSWIWIASWFERPLRWFVLAVKENPDDDGYVAFFPLRLRTEFETDRGFFNAVAMGGSHYAVYTGILCEPGREDRAIPALADCLRSFNWTSLHLDDIYISPERLNLFLRHFPSREFVTEKVVRPVHRTAAGENIDHDVYVYVPLPGDFERFLNERLGSKTRRNVRLYLRTLDEAGEFRVTHANAETIERDLNIFYGMWEAQWGTRNRRYTDSILENSRHMLIRCFRDGSLFLPVLWKGDTPIAVFVTFLDPHRKSVVCFLGGRDPAIRNPSPGLLLHAYIIRWAIANGFAIYDLGTGNYSYKYVLGSVEHLVEGIRIVTSTGRNIGDRLDRRSLPVAASRVAHFIDTGDLASAELGCRQILAADPRHFDACHQLGIILFRQGDAKGAEVQIREALEMRPDAASAHCNYGNVLAALGQFDGALSSYERAIAIEPRHAIAFNNRGNLLRRLGRTGEALASYERAIALRPDYGQALKNRAAILQQMRSPAAQPV